MKMKNAECGATMISFVVYVHVLTC